MNSRILPLPNYVTTFGMEREGEMPKEVSASGEVIDRLPQITSFMYTPARHHLTVDSQFQDVVSVSLATVYFILYQASTTASEAGL